jgi:hypothetical protein
VPRPLPALGTALFHGAIRTAHAVRAIDTADIPPRRAELARALGYWAARYRAGALPAGDSRPASDVQRAVVNAAADGARRYLARPTVPHLHGVTGAMALEILAAQIPAAAAAAAAAAAGLAQLRAEHTTLYRGVPP